MDLVAEDGLKVLVEFLDGGEEAQREADRRHEAYKQAVADKKRAMLEADAKIAALRTEWARAQNAVKKSTTAANQIMATCVPKELRTAADKATSAANKAERLLSEARDAVTQARFHYDRRKAPEYAVRRGKRVKVREKASSSELAQAASNVEKLEFRVHELEVAAKRARAVADKASEAVSEAFNRAVDSGRA